MIRIISITTHIIAVFAAIIILIVGFEIKQLMLPIDNESFAKGFNSVTLNLSYSYITGYMVYILTVYYPHIRIKKKIKPIIERKYNIINGKLLDSIRCVFPMTEWNSLVLTKELFKNQFGKHSLHDNCSYEMADIKRSIINHLIGQRENIEEIVKEILEYRNFISDESLLLLESVRESDYFAVLNAFSQIKLLDNETERMKLANHLFDLYEMLKQQEIVLS